MGGTEPSRAPPWGCSHCGGAPPSGSRDRCLAEAEADAPRASSRPPSATPRARPAAFLFYFFSPSRCHTECAAPCHRLGLEIRRLPPRSRPSTSSPSGSLRISTPTSSASSPADHEVAWPKLGEDAARQRELMEDGRRWREGTARLRHRRRSKRGRHCRPCEVEEEEDRLSGVHWRRQLLSDAYSSSRRHIPRFGLRFAPCPLEIA
jgi:hypothetical protein